MFYIKSSTTKGIGEYKLTNWTDYDVDTAIPFCTGQGDDLIEFLTYNNMGSKKDLFVIQSCIHSYPEDLHEFLYDALMKRIKLKVSPAMINEVYGKGFLPSIDYMPPDTYFDRDNVLYIRDKQYIAYQKVGGVKCVAIKEKGGVQLYGRNGELIFNLDLIEREIERLPHDNMVLDGFILYNGKEPLTYEERNKKTTSGIRSKSTIRTMTFWIYDFISLEDYKNKLGTLKYRDRLVILQNLINHRQHLKLPKILYDGVARSAIKDLYDEARLKKAGGIYLYLKEGYYTFHKSPVYVEFKSFYQVEATIVDYKMIEGTDLLSCFIVSYNQQIASVYLGYLQEEREKFGQDPYLYIGEKVIIQCNRIKQNEDGTQQIITPVFLRFKDRKDFYYGPSKSQRNKMQKLYLLRDM